MAISDLKYTPHSTDEVILHHIRTILSEGYSIGGYSKGNVEDSLTRPSNTTAYTANDVVRSAGFTFVDADVSAANDTITEAAHGLTTGQVVELFNSGGTLPAGLSLLTLYYVIKVDADTFKLATSVENATDGTAVNITAAAGGGTHTLVRSLEFTVGRHRGGSGLVIGATLTSSANQATLGNFTLALFDTPTIFRVQDNAPIAMADAAVNNLIGLFKFNATDNGQIFNTGSGADGSVGYTGVSTAMASFNCDSNNDKIYGVLIANNAYTPVSGEIFTVKLRIEQNA